MKFIFAFVLSFILTFIFTPIARFIAVKHNVLDIPKDLRKVHLKATPLLGGLAVYFAIVIVGLIFLEFSYSLLGIFLGATLMLIVGVWDDKTDISPKVKFLFQIIAAVIAFLFGVRIDFITNPLSMGIVDLQMIVSFSLTVFWIVGITNTINLIDGLDGLSSGISFISLLTFAFISYEMGYIEMTLLSLIVAGAALGFLPYNFHPASIFIGDGGALLLGFLIATISIESLMKSTALITLAIPLLSVAVPIFDTAFAIIRRLLSGKKVYMADKGHLHHRLMAKGYGQRKTVLILYGISIVYSVLAILMTNMVHKYALYLTVIVFLATLFMAYLLGLFKMKN